MISPSGRVSLVGVTEQVLDRQKYEGSWLAPGVPPGYDDELRGAHLAMARRAYRAGYHGVVGFDSFAADTGETFPAVEINARLNMSMYALAVMHRLGVFSAGCLRSYTLKETETTRLRSFLDRLGAARLYRPGRGSGLLPLSFSGRTTPVSAGVLRFHLLYLGDGREEIEALRRDTEAQFR
jgi:hypothetical protein